MFLCFSIFKFYKVVQQHSVSKVEVFMTELPLESDYQDLENKSTSAEIITKSWLSCF